MNGCYCPGGAGGGGGAFSYLWLATLPHLVVLLDDRLSLRYRVPNGLGLGGSLGFS